MKSCIFFLGSSLFFSWQLSAAENVPNGEALYGKYCSVCHSISPPALNAPAMRSIAALYHRKYQQRSEGVARIAAFIKLPSVKNALDQVAISRYGLMARVPATSKETQAVSEWLWDQAGGILPPVKGR
ncbi:MAG: cytochrome c [Chlorobiaceae bacterium]|nr:cytochrome c [Chlorobiaceae bacterium]NTV59787.1 cytochrome c [Chlorobiaceae bacterium]